MGDYNQLIPYGITILLLGALASGVIYLLNHHDRPTYPKTNNIWDRLAGNEEDEDCVEEEEE